MKRRVLIGILVGLALLLSGQMVLGTVAPGGGGSGGWHFCCEEDILYGFANSSDCQCGCNTYCGGYCTGWQITGCYITYYCSTGCSETLGPFGHWTRGDCGPSH
jgi:hypothetical protein